jgi:hypothetical protein
MNKDPDPHRDRPVALLQDGLMNKGRPYSSRVPKCDACTYPRNHMTPICTLTRLSRGTHELADACTRRTLITCIQMLSASPVKYGFGVRTRSQADAYDSIERAIAIGNLNQPVEVQLDMSWAGRTALGQRRV